MTNNLKHTKGPWRWDTDRGTLEGSDPDADSVLVLDGHVAQPSLEDRNLIAAAPDLLAAAIKVYDEYYHQPYSETYDALRAAIYAATKDDKYD